LSQHFSILNSIPERSTAVEQLRNDNGAVRSPGRQDNLERARLYFERKAGRPVSSAEAREWLDSLVEYLRTAQRWAEEAAAREASATIQPLAQDPGQDTQTLPPAPASRRIAAHRISRTSGQHIARNTQDVITDVQTARAAPQGTQMGRE
jgi:hypothetical protein